MEVASFLVAKLLVLKDVPWCSRALDFLVLAPRGLIALRSENE
jgi:hypothetical protein